MRRVTQTLPEILLSLRPLQVEWQDAVAKRVIGRLRSLPIRDVYGEGDIRTIIENGKPANSLSGQDFEDGLLIVRTFLGLSKDQFSGALADALGAGGAGLNRYRKDPAGFLTALTDLGLLDALAAEVARPPHWTDVLLERLRSGRGSAISGQKRGRVAEDFAEAIIRRVFGADGYEVRATFVGRNGVAAKCDFAIPNRSDSRIVVESKGFRAVPACVATGWRLERYRMKEQGMPSPLSMDLRERVVGAVAEGASFHRAAARFGVSVSSASRWSERFAQEGHVAPKPRGGTHPTPAIEAHADLILALYEAQPAIFLDELRDALSERGVVTSTSGLSRFFQRHRITRKKGRFMRLSRSGRT